MSCMDAPGRAEQLREAIMRLAKLGSHCQAT